jgi:protein-L-isoaspartate(D-aspartate) O-methyltransferase
VTREELLEELGRQIADPRVLDAVGAVAREAFVLAQDRDRAWGNHALGIDCGQTISQPIVVARMCEALAVRPGDRVLDVGTGSGYHAAVLAALGARVSSIEIQPELSRRAAQRLGPEVELVVGDGRLGHPPRAPYEAISVAATAEDEVPSALLEQLAPGGRLVAPLRERGIERLVLLTRRADGRGFLREDLEEVRFVPLV